MELVDLYNEDRASLGKTAERYAKHGQGEYRTVVHVCLFNSREELLIQHRTPDKVIWPGKWDVSVGGGVDAGETSREGAQREFREELGYPLDLTGIRPALTLHIPQGFDDFYVVTKDVELEELSLQREEVSEVRWVSKEELLEMVEDGRFIPYQRSFLELLFDLRGKDGFPTK